MNFGIANNTYSTKIIDYSKLYSNSNSETITFYESFEYLNSSSSSNQLKTTSVWELDMTDHRDVIKSEMFIRELIEELNYLFKKKGNNKNKQQFCSKKLRMPTKDEHCEWDYLRARCKWLDYCSYQYRFGDISLDQSCRLKNKAIIN
eukprot:TRINITY_DN4504_c0_g1_i2.p1 TRINITY_DN4504_c0_g1~~TRINITY_DN4504_c0_g1_i2.p1  ORF type:complete len:147 (-),score=53.88 TRINITY_DN4504_c0_g1_i2:3-443(-)